MACRRRKADVSGLREDREGRHQERLHPQGPVRAVVEKQFPRLRPYADVSDVGKAAKDWPQLNFVVYHSAYRQVGGTPADGMAEFDQTGRSSWISDLAEIPEKYGVTNVYGDLGQMFA